MATGRIIKGTQTWWEISALGINPEKGCTHPNEPREYYHPEIVQVIRRTTVPNTPCIQRQIKAKIGRPIKSEKRNKSILLKNTFAAEKMVHLAALGKSVGEGGRDVKKWRLENRRSKGMYSNDQHNSPPRPQTFLLAEKGKGTRDTTKFYRLKREVSIRKKNPPVLLNIGLLFALICVNLIQAEDNPHQPFSWTLVNWETQKVLQTNVTSGPPSFSFFLCDVIQMRPCLNLRAWYLCPASNPGKSYCNYPNEYYCAYWDCVTLAIAWKSNIEDPFLDAKWGPPGCKRPVYDSTGGSSWSLSEPPSDACKYVTVTVKQPNHQGWITGKTWGIRIWEPGKDRGGLFYIKKSEVKTPHRAVGPNQVLTNSSGEKIKNNFTMVPVMNSIQTTQTPDMNLEDNYL